MVFRDMLLFCNALAKHPGIDAGEMQDTFLTQICRVLSRYGHPSRGRDAASRPVATAVALALRKSLATTTNLHS